MISTRSVVLLVLLSAACRRGDSATPLPWATVIDTVGDTVVARTTGEPPDSLIRQLVAEWEAAGDATDSARSIGDVSGMAVGQDGKVYVWDPVTPALWLLEPDGTGLRQISRLGSGPGEYRRSSGLAIARDGAVVLWDEGNARLNTYEPDGRYRSTSPLPISFCCPGNAATMDTSGRLWLEIMLFNSDKSKPPSKRPGEEDAAFILLDPAGTMIDTMIMPPLPGDYPRLTAINETATGISMSSSVMPYSPFTVRAASPFGYPVTGQGRPYAIHAEWGGKPLRIEGTATPVPVPPAEREQMRARFEFMLRRVKSDWKWDGPDIPGEKPAFFDLNVAADGRIWASLNPASEPYEPDAPADNRTPAAPPVRFRERDNRWDVFEPDGHYLGRLLTSRLFTAYVMRGDSVWGVMLDDNDVPTVVKMRITPGF